VETQILPYGVDVLHVFDSPYLSPYTTRPHTAVLVKLFEREQPQICLMGATSIGRDLGPRVSSSLTSGLTADCTALEIGNFEDKKNKKTYENLLYQIRPAFGGNIVATIINPDNRPQMATVRSGVMKAEVLDAAYKGEVIQHFPYGTETEEITPIYTELKGWNTDLSTLKNSHDLPKELLDYIRFIEKEVEVPITLVSVGADRTQTIVFSINPLIMKHIYLSFLSLTALVLTTSCNTDGEIRQVEGNILGTPLFTPKKDSIALEFNNIKVSAIQTNSQNNPILGQLTQGSLGTTNVALVTQALLSSANPTFGEKTQEQEASSYNENETVEKVYLYLPFFSTEKNIQDPSDAKKTIKTYTLDSIVGDYRQEVKDFGENFYRRTGMNYISENQSIEGELFFNDRFSVIPKGNGKYSATSVKLGYNYYFEEDGGTGLYVNPFIKQRFGTFSEDGVKTRLDSFILGVGAGYQWNLDDTFIIAPFANIARNFGKQVNENKKFWAIEPNFGIKIGYKF